METLPLLRLMMDLTLAVARVPVMPLRQLPIRVEVVWLLGAPAPPRTVAAPYHIALLLSRFHPTNKPTYQSFIHPQVESPQHPSILFLMRASTHSMSLIHAPAHATGVPNPYLIHPGRDRVCGLRRTALQFRCKQVEDVDR